MSNKLELLLEAERRGILPDDKRVLLDEARRRGLVGGQPAEAPQGVDFSAGEMISNIPQSAYQYGKGIYDAVSSPIETGKAVGRVALGAVDKGVEGLTSALPGEVVGAVNRFNNWLVNLGVPLKRLPEGEGVGELENVKYANAVIDAMKERYGSIDAIKRTAMEDPVGVMADAASVLVGGGTLAPGMAKAGAMIEPLNVAKNVTRTTGRVLGKAIPESLPTRLYESAAKFSTRKGAPDPTDLSKTALEYRVPLSQAGYNKVTNAIDTLENKLDSLITKSTETGKRIPKKAVLVHMKELRNRLAGKMAEGSKDKRTINRVIKDFDEHMKTLPDGESFTVRELQDFKVNLGQKIKWAREKSPTKEQTFKSMRRASREAIEKEVPEVGDVNRQLGRLYELEEGLEPQIGRVRKRDISGIGVPIKTAAGAATAGPAGAVTGTALGILDTPRVKSNIAIMLNDLRTKGLLDDWIDQNMITTAGRLGAYQASAIPPDDGP